MQTIIFFVVAFVAVVVGEDFAAFKKTYSKSYASKADEAIAAQNYKANSAAIDKHNKDPNSTYKQSTNSHSDEPAIAIKNSANTEAKYPKGKSARNMTMPPVSNKKVKYAYPALLDYSKIMGPVKDQTTCIRGDWVFSSIAAVEYHAAKNGTPKVYSEQNLIDCVTANKGCTDPAASMYAGYIYMISNGIAEQSAYPWNGQPGNCQKSTIPPSYHLNDASISNPNGDEAMLKFLLTKYGPIGISVYQSANFLNYKSGVFYDPKCISSSSSGPFYMTLMGYGTDPTAGDYWIIRNFKGPSWGENGYMRLARNKGNQCGVANLAEVIVPY